MRNAETPVEPVQPDRFPGMVKVMVTLERPSSQELAGYNRDMRYQVLRNNSVEFKEGLIHWIKEQGLSHEVAEIGDATAFNVLFLVCTPQVAERLLQAPGVVNVSLAGDFRVDLRGRANHEQASDPNATGDGKL
ncbi:MAG: hypothetical protein RML36_12065 [Anaerolineae bacterium]|nr:hypothetical protein [Anaerolineae bacterium]MDW8100205.1 hypothetical protein [Anaerolineae bacterium]